MTTPNTENTREATAPTPEENRIGNPTSEFESDALHAGWNGWDSFQRLEYILAYTHYSMESGSDAKVMLFKVLRTLIRERALSQARPSPQEERHNDGSLAVVDYRKPAPGESEIATLKAERDRYRTALEEIATGRWNIFAVEGIARAALKGEKEPAHGK